MKSICFIIFIFIINISYISNSSYNVVISSLKESAYSLYMRGKIIQYVGKGSPFYPEDATQQNINYLICSYFVESTYKDLLTTYIPTESILLFRYSELYLGNPEIILYPYINEKNISELLLYSPNEEKHYKAYTTFSIKDIIPLVRIGDISTYTSHIKIIYDIIKDSKGNVIDAIIMEPSLGPAKTHIKTKFTQMLSFLYLNNKINTYFEEGREEGTTVLNGFSTYGIQNNINNENRAKK